MKAFYNARKSEKEPAAPGQAHSCVAVKGNARLAILTKYPNKGMLDSGAYPSQCPLAVNSNLFANPKSHFRDFVPPAKGEGTITASGDLIPSSGSASIKISQSIEPMQANLSTDLDKPLFSVGQICDLGEKTHIVFSRKKALILCGDLTFKGLMCLGSAKRNNGVYLFDPKASPPGHPALWNTQTLSAPAENLPVPLPMPEPDPNLQKALRDYIGGLSTKRNKWRKNNCAFNPDIENNETTWH